MSGAQVTLEQLQNADKLLDRLEDDYGISSAFAHRSDVVRDIAQALADAEAAERERQQQFAKNAIWSPAQKQACINEIQGALASADGSWPSVEAFALHLVSTICARGQS